MPLTAGARLGPYEIRSAIGAGGMGEVYRARDTRLDRDVAIKVLPPEFADDAERLTRFEREAKAAAMHHAAGGIPIADYMLGTCLMYAGYAGQAAEVFARGAAGGAGVLSDVQSVLGAALRGDRNAVRGALIDPVTRTAFRIDKELAWVVSAACAMVGDTDEALGWLSAAIDMGFINHRFFAEHDPFFVTLRGDPRFDGLMDRARETQRACEV
jgi:hypothetical protein